MADSKRDGLKIGYPRRYPLYPDKFKWRAIRVAHSPKTLNTCLNSSPQLPRQIEAAFQEFHLALPVSENHSSSEFVTVFKHPNEDVVFQLCGTRCLQVPLLTNLMLWSLTDFFGLRLERFPIQFCSQISWVSTDFHGFRKDTALASLPLGGPHHPIHKAKLCHPVCQKLQVLWLQRCPHRLLDIKRFSLIHDS